MEDTEIVELFRQRNTDALRHAGQKYGRLCKQVARNILPCTEDAEECINDAYLALWNSIPPKRPQSLGGYMATLVRNSCLTRYRREHTQKRGSGQVDLALEELSEVLAGQSDVEKDFEAKALTREINRFLSTLSKDDRIIFLSRYWLMLSAPEMEAQLGFSHSKITSSLFRSRNKLKAHLIKEEWL